MKQHGLSLPMEPITNQAHQNLTVELSGHWTELLQLIDLLGDEPREQALGHVLQIRTISCEFKLQSAVEMMRHAEHASDLAQHSRRLETFLLRLVSICAEQNFSAARPVCESLGEYLEARKLRKLPTEAELRARLEQKIKAKREQHRMA